VNKPIASLTLAAQALGANRIEEAERIIRSHLAVDPDHPEALRLLGGVAAATGHLADAEQLFQRAIDRDPSYVPPYADLCALLARRGRLADAVALLDRIMATRGAPPWALSLKAATLMGERRPEEALPALEQLVARVPDAAIPHVNLGDALQAAGQLDRAVSAYRTAIRLDPANGFAWWGLANLRTIRLDANDVALLQQASAEAEPGLGTIQLGFALGKALEDVGRYEESFRHYEEANRQRGQVAPYDPQAMEAYVRAIKTTFTAAMLAPRKGRGHGSDAPIFIVGMPRSGSTLVEQILASHPLVEGLGELFELPNIATQIGGSGKPKAALPAIIANLTAAQLSEIGENYLAATQRFRRTDRPFFTDKMPANWRLIPLIRLALPNARIIDVRRDPMPCCFSAFTTYFNRHTSFPVNLTDLARYYRDYLAMMEHLAGAQPEAIHQLSLETLIAQPEAEVRRLLAYLDLPFDDACLRSHENRRPVYTPSAQQVRQPIQSETHQRWQSYEPWLHPLKDGLR
jgi:tetratricopeptide (TPR) repeat protein